MILSAIDNYFNKAKQRPISLNVDDTGVFFNKNGESVASFKWNDVEKIITYKQGLSPSDLLCLEFKLKNQTVYLTHQQIDGFDDLKTQLPKNFSNILDDWPVKIMQPAFNKNHEVLYQCSG